MMLFRLSLRNLKKSVQDYTIYFLTLVLGVAVFYVFNALDSQGVMLAVSASTREMIQLMLGMLAGVSVFVSLILGFLIVYANNFLIRRRKKEFGVYMTLGMSRGGISRILLGETVVIGLASLAVGLVIGVFASQLMSILVARMFEADMTAYAFTFSAGAARKTVLYFGMMYLLVILFNAGAISRYQLLDLLTAGRKNEQVRMKNPLACTGIFLLSLGLLAYCYLNVLGVWGNVVDRNRMIVLIGLGSLATFLFFWSLSGLALRLAQAGGGFYFKGLNFFVLRQVNSRVNTMVCAMTVICLMLFLTIGVLSCGVSMNQSLTAELEEQTPRDICLVKSREPEGQTQEEADAGIPESLRELGFSPEGEFLEYVEATSYTRPDLTWESTLGDDREVVMAQFPMLEWEKKEELVPLSSYNRMARYYGIEAYELKEDEYLLLCTFESMGAIRERGLKVGAPLVIGGKSYHPKYDVCMDGYLAMGSSRTNLGIFVLPDSAFSEEGMEPYQDYLAADYRAAGKEEKYEANERLEQIRLTEECAISGYSKIAIRESSVGVAAMVTFIALYLGIVFLISSAAVLALKELSDSADNRERYRILQELGADQAMIRKAIFWQIGIFFLLPLGLAFVHSVFGVQFVNRMLLVMNQDSQEKSILFTAVFILAVYGGYFLATYLGSRRIIEEADGRGG